MKRKDERSWPYTPTQWFHRSVANSCFQGCINSDVHLESTRYSIIVKIHNLHAYFHTPTWTSSLLFSGPHATNVEIQPRHGEYAWCCSAWDIAQKPLRAPNTTSALRDWQHSHSQSPKAVAASSRGSSVRELHSKSYWSYLVWKFKTYGNYFENYTDILEVSTEWGYIEIKWAVKQNSSKCSFSPTWVYAR